MTPFAFSPQRAHLGSGHFPHPPFLLQLNCNSVWEFWISLACWNQWLLGTMNVVQVLFREKQLFAATPTLWQALRLLRLDWSQTVANCSHTGHTQGEPFSFRSRGYRGFEAHNTLTERDTGSIWRSLSCFRVDWHWGPAALGTFLGCWAGCSNWCYVE